MGRIGEKFGRCYCGCGCGTWRWERFGNFEAGYVLGILRQATSFSATARTLSTLFQKVGGGETLSLRLAIKKFGNKLGKYFTTASAVCSNLENASTQTTAPNKTNLSFVGLKENLRNSAVVVFVDLSNHISNGTLC